MSDQQHAGAPTPRRRATDQTRRPRLIERLSLPARPRGTRPATSRRRLWLNCAAWLSMVTTLMVAMLLWLQADTRNVVTTFRRSGEYSWMPMQSAIWSYKLRVIALRSHQEPWSDDLWSRFDNARDVFFHRVTMIVDSHNLTAEFRAAPSFAEADALLRHARDELDRIHVSSEQGLTPADARTIIALLDGLDPVMTRLIAELRNLDIEGRAAVYGALMSRRNDFRWAAAGVWLLLSLSGTLWLRSRARQSEEEHARHEQLELKLAAMQTAEELIETRNSILNMVAHDLRSPLQVLMSATETLQMKLPDDQPELLELTRQIDNTTEQIATHLRDLNTFAKALDATIDTQGQPVDLDEMTQAAFTAPLRTLACDKGVTVHVAVDGMKSGLRADRTRLIQILGNLIENAIKYTERGSINVMVETRPLNETSVMLTFTVTDTGLGMTPNEVKTAFDPFVRLPSTQGRDTPGFGLGLSLVKHLVALLHGTMEVRSTPGIGSAFVVRLPTAICNTDAFRAHVAAHGNIVEINTEATTVLIVDDVPEVLNALIDSVKRQGAIPLGASNAAEAIALSNVHQVDLALIDYQMPVRDGLSLAVELSRDHPDMYLVMISAFPEPDVFDDAALRAIGAHDFAEKPLKGATIRRLIESARTRPH